MFRPIKWLIWRTRFSPSKRKRLNLNLGSINIDEQIKADLEVMDRYQRFSAELLRLSLLGIGVYAFLFRELLFSSKNTEPNSFINVFVNTPTLKALNSASIIFFAIAAACTLVHRYYSSDALAYHARYLRIKIYLANCPENIRGTQEEVNASEVANEEREDRDTILQLCEVMIASSAIFVGLGAICLSVALITLLF